MADNVYTIFDKKAQVYGPLFTAQNDPTAIRQVQMMQEGESLLSQHPDDFAVFRIATYDNQTGVLTGNAALFVYNLNNQIEETEQ